MSEKNIYLVAEESILNEIDKEKSLFSFRALIKLFTACSIAKKF